MWGCLGGGGGGVWGGGGGLTCSLFLFCYKNHAGGLLCFNRYEMLHLVSPERNGVSK